MIVNSHDRPASLPAGEVHLWFLTDVPSCVGSYCADGFVLLSSQEKQRFIGMKNRIAARRFLLSRVMMRRVLARYLDEDPAALVLRQNANGKPELDGPPANGLSFNLSHSASSMVLAVARASAIGVDMESMGRADAAHRISQQFFSNCENRDLEALGAQAPGRALMLWALKESIVKANGDTVWDGLEKLPLAIEGSQIIWRTSQMGVKHDWQLAVGTYSEDYIIACAIRTSGAEFDEGFLFRTRCLEEDLLENHSFQPRFNT